jgi:hypothetical protein
MSGADLSVRIRDLGESLTALEADLAHRKTAPAGLDEFKDAIDEVRTNLLAIVTATHSGDYDASIGAFRMRRTNDVCQNLMADVIDGTVSPATEGFEECYVAALNLYNQLTKGA